jgi:hypothetical protein
MSAGDNQCCLNRAASKKGSAPGSGFLSLWLRDEKPHHHLPFMQKPLFLTSVVTAAVFVGCSSPGPETGKPVERGPQGTVAYEVQIDSNEPGVRIETNKEYAGPTPLVLKIFGDKDGTFHSFGNPNYIIQAVPVKAGQNLQTKYFHTGDDFIGDDKIPKRIYFDMAQPENTVVEGQQVPKK